MCIDSRQQVTKPTTAAGYERKLEMMRVADQPQNANQNYSVEVPDVDRARVGSDNESDQKDVSGTCSTRYSDGDVSLAGNELGSWSNEEGLPVSLHDDSSDDVVAPVLVSDVPTVGDVCVKDSPNVHFGQKTFYNGPVTVEKIVCPNPNSTDANADADVDRSYGIPKERDVPNSDNGTGDPENSREHHKGEYWYLNHVISWSRLFIFLSLFLPQHIIITCAFLIYIYAHPHSTQKQIFLN